MNRRTLAFSLAAALALTGFSACSAPGKIPVAVNDPVSAAANTTADPVDQLVNHYDYSYQDVTQELFELSPSTDPIDQFLPAPREENFLSEQELTNLAAAIFEKDTGLDFSQQQFELVFHRQTWFDVTNNLVDVTAYLPGCDETQDPKTLTDYANGNPTLTVSAQLDATTGRLLSYSGSFTPQQPVTDDTRETVYLERAKALCAAAGLGELSDCQYSAADSFTQSLWATLDNGDRVVFHLDQPVLTFENATAMGGQGRVDALLKNEIVDDGGMMQ